jgi:hypothetical protein
VKGEVGRERGERRREKGERRGAKGERRREKGEGRVVALRRRSRLLLGRQLHCRPECRLRLSSVSD